MTSSFAYRAPDKTFWFSGKGCLWHFVGTDFVRVNLPPEIANQSESLQTIAEDQQGGIWVSFGRGGLYRLANGNWTPYGGRNDLAKTGRVMVTFTDRLGRVWFGNLNGQLAVLDSDRVRVFRSSNDLQVGKITAIYGRGPEIWVGGEFGLEKFDQERFTKIAAMDDEWLRGISGIVETAQRRSMAQRDFRDFPYPEGGNRRSFQRLYVSSQGRALRQTRGTFRGSPARCVRCPPPSRAPMGDCGSQLRNGVVWLDPAAYAEKRTVPPPITIQAVSADDKFYAPDPRLSLPAHTSSVQISYSAVSLSDPEAIRFHYKLLETDKDWHEAPEATPVTYRNLPPGSYHFSVEASDTNGAWSGAPANMAFTILPAFYQTTVVPFVVRGLRFCRRCGAYISFGCRAVWRASST